MAARVRVRMDVKWKGGYAKAAERAATMRGLEKAADHLKEKSLEIVPRETQALADSATASSDPGQLRAAVSYDGEYAVWQHEDRELHHEGDEKSKYLETPFRREKDEMRRIIAAELGQEFKR